MNKCLLKCLPLLIVLAWVSLDTGIVNATYYNCEGNFYRYGYDSNNNEIPSCYATGNQLSDVTSDDDDACASQIESWAYDNGSIGECDSDCVPGGGTPAGWFVTGNWYDYDDYGNGTFEYGIGSCS